MAQVDLVQVSKVYEDRIHAVVDATLTVRDREFLVLVGPSGCGKSTILRMIAGLEEPTSGEIHIEGRPVTHVPPKERDIAMIFQDFALYPHMTVYDNMAFPLKMRRLPKDEVHRRVMKTAGLMGIESLLDRKPHRVSGGERQRVALGRALVRDPKVFLMDEPLSNLDAKLRVQMRMEIQRLHRRLEATMVYVTHDQTEAMTMGTRIAVLRDGRIQQVDTPRRIYEQPANTFVASFIGAPPMNLLEGRISADGENTHFLCGDIAIPFPADRAGELVAAGYRETAVLLGIRPEHVQVQPVEERGGGEVASLSGRVDLVEDTGAEIYASVDLPFGSVLVRSQPNKALTPGTPAHLRFAPEHLHLFDAASGMRINGSGPV